MLTKTKIFTTDNISEIREKTTIIHSDIIKQTTLSIAKKLWEKDRKIEAFEIMKDLGFLIQVSNDEIPKVLSNATDFQRLVNENIIL